MKRRAIAAGPLLLCCLGCAAGTAPPAAERRPLMELYSWWAAPGEAEALEALIDAHRRVHPEARVFNAAAASGTRARETLSARLARNDPPDLFQEYVHDLRAAIGNAAGKRTPLDDMIARLGLRDVIFPEVLADVTSDGAILALPVNMHREDTLLYNRRLLDAHNIRPPTTIAELLDACKRLKAAGVIPVATAAQGWILRIMFNAIAIGSMGGPRYRDYFTGKKVADLTPLRDAIAVFGEIMEKYTNPDAAEEGFNWTTAAQLVYNGDAAMILHGDWVKAYWAQLGWRPDVDFGVMAAPGAADVFLYGVDGFALPTGAMNEAGARAFLETIASIDGQIAFNRLKGSTPVRRDIPKGQLDSVGRRTFEDFERASIRMLVRSRPSWEDALAAFARDRDRAKLLQAFIDEPPGP
jgi:glucose/mannose transport system substrate-binding protein